MNLNKFMINHIYLEYLNIHEVKIIKNNRNINLM